MGPIISCSTMCLMCSAIRLLSWFFLRPFLTLNFFFPHHLLLFCLSPLTVHVHFLIFLLFPRSPPLFLPAHPASFLYPWWASDRAGLCDFSWSSNYLNFVCSWARCACVHVCLRAKAVLLDAVPSHVDLSSVLKAESVNHSASSSQKYISAPSVHTPHSGSH